MSTTPQTKENGAVDEMPEPSPEYLALPKSEREQMDALVESTQGMQNHVDQNIAIMGEPVYFLAGMLLSQELRIRTLKRQVLDLQTRLTDLEERVS